MSRLASNVHVDGTWYGPSYGNADQVPAEVAAKITNPAAWGEGEAPSAAEEQQHADGAPSHREALEARARELGVAVRSNMKDETLAERIAEAEASDKD